MLIETDVLVVGGGSSGFGAAYSALKNGMRVVLAERFNILGGTSTIGGVNNWEPGVSGNGVHYKLAERLIENKKGFVGKTVSFCKPGQPYAVSDRASDDYESTLKRYGVSEEDQRRFHFEPVAMSNEMERLLYEKGNKRLTLLYGTSFVSLKISNREITSVEFKSSTEKYIVIPKIVIDCTGNIILARSAGCTYDIGENSFSEYCEKSAPSKRSTRLNGLTKCFILERNISPKITIPLDDQLVKREYKNVTDVVSCFYVCPDRSFEKGTVDDPLSRIVGTDARISVNMLPTFEGEAVLKYSAEELERLCLARIIAYRNNLADKYSLGNWNISYISPLTSIREDYRLIGKYVLTNEEQANGFASSLGEEHTVAYADHPTDIHGEGGCLKKTGLYQIPYECMLPNEVDNLLVACRGASFSHIAASSARLSRTMIALGEAAGNAAAVCILENIFPHEMPKSQIRELMPK